MAALRQQINIVGKKFFPLTYEWQAEAEELYKATGETWSQVTYAFLDKLGRECFDGKVKHFTLRRLGKLLGFGYTQVKVHLGRAIRTGIVNLVDSGWTGIEIQLMNLSRLETSTPANEVQPPASKPTVPNSTTPTVPGSRFTREERRQAANQAADEAEATGNAPRNRKRFVISLINKLPDDEVAERLENLALRQEEVQQVTEANRREETALIERQRAQEAECAALYAKFTGLSEADQRQIKDRAVARLAAGLRALVHNAGGIDKMQNSLVREQYDAALLRELRT